MSVCTASETLMIVVEEAVCVRIGEKVVLIALNAPYFTMNIEPTHILSDLINILFKVADKTQKSCLLYLLMIQNSNDP